MQYLYFLKCLMISTLSLPSLNISYSTISIYYISLLTSIILTSIHNNNMKSESFYLITLSYYIFIYINSLLFNCTLQVEFHVPDFEIALNNTRIITSDIILRYEHSIMTYSNVLHNVLIMIFTYFS